MKISACWIVKNEEKNLERSVRSLSRVADELIIVDTGSEDGTVDIAKALKASVYDFAWINDFSAARNFALSKASGDVVIFLDADEWFQPALARQDRRVIEDAFQRPEVEALMLRLTNINADSNELLDSFSNVRIYRLHPAIRYVGSIHETPQRKAGDSWRYLATMDYAGWTIYHSGYTPSLMLDKLDRNIRMMETELGITEDPYELFILHSLLMRENYSSDKFESALPHLLYMLLHPAYFTQAYEGHKEEFLQRAYYAMHIAKAYRNLISRRQIFQCIVLPAKEHLSESNSQILELFYLFLFGCQPDRYLALYSQCASRLPSLSDRSVAGRHTVMVYLKTYTASLYLDLGSNDKAFELIDEVLRDPDNCSVMTLSILIDCLYGQADDAILPYLLSVLDMDNSSVYPKLIETLVGRRKKTIFLFLQKRLLDAGKLSMPDVLFLMLIQQNYEQLGMSVDAMTVSEEQRDAVERQLFLAALACGDPAFYLKYKGRLPHYAHILEAYWAETPLASITDSDWQVLADNYPLLAFAVDRETADRFAELFSAYPLSCFALKAGYYYYNHLDQELALLDRDNLPLWEKDSYAFLCRSLIRSGKEEEGLSILDALLQGERYGEQLFLLLYILGQNDRGDTGKKAKALYDRYVLTYNNLIDSLDEQRANPADSTPAEVISLDAYRAAKQAES